MRRTFTGRPVLAGRAVGEAVVTRQGFNTLSTFYRSMLINADRAICNDQDNPDIFGLEITGRIICLPKSIGSTSAGATWDRVAKMGIAPKAMLFSERIDSLAAAGLVLAEIWVGQRIITVDRLGPDFLDSVTNGQQVKIDEDGLVTLIQ